MGMRKRLNQQQLHKVSRKKIDLKKKKKDEKRKQKQKEKVIKRENKKK